MVYLSEHRSLAALETLVHAPRPALLAAEYVMVEVTIPDGLLLKLDVSELSPGWNSPSDFTQSQAIGDAWLNEHASVALRVPSAIVPEETNVLLSPAHPDFLQLQFGEARPFLFDARLTG